MAFGESECIAAATTEIMKLFIGTTAVAATMAAFAWNQGETDSSYAATFDAHWEVLREGYPYFELYGVDWEAERDEHRPRAVAAANDDEFAWELARLVCALPDPHVAFVPALSTLQGRWSVPEIEAKLIERRPFIVEWPGGRPTGFPERYLDDEHAYPEIIEIAGMPALGVAEILAAGPLGTTLELRLRWPDGSETEHEFVRSATPNLPPPKKHFGEDWLVVGRVGSIGYMGVRTFNPSQGTLGPDGKMTTMLRAALEELRDTTGLVLDFPGQWRRPGCGVRSVPRELDRAFGRLSLGELGWQAPRDSPPFTALPRWRGRSRR